MTDASAPARLRSPARARPARTGTADLATPVIPGWALLPLRAFLGCTFVYAGLQKLADPSFFRASAASSIQSQLQAASRTSPIGGMLGPLHRISLIVGLVVALSELAVGVATLLGRWSRLAAAVGLSLGFRLPPGGQLAQSALLPRT